MRRIYYYLELENISPIHIGNGQNDITDLDVIKDKNGCFYIPGTSIAGSIIHYLSEEERKIILPELVVDKRTVQTKQSPLFISDARLIDSNTNLIEARDGIALDEYKVTIDGAKYNYQVVPANRKFELLMEITDRDNNNYEDIMEKVFSAINNQDIKVGFKTTRGLGRLKINKLGKKVFTKDNFEEYFSFNRYNYFQYDDMDIKEVVSKRYTTIKLVLKQKGGISIRTYNTSKEDVDYKHIHSNGKAVIPATSWNGLIRKTLSDYNNKLSLNLDINTLFGCIEQKTKKARKSKIFIDESVLKDGKNYIQTRIRINPFHAGTVDGALYNEESYYHGNTCLVVRIDNNVEKLELIKQLFVLFAVDLNNGFIALGGETSIGRGLFEVSAIDIDGQQININDYIRMEG